MNFNFFVNTQVPEGVAGPGQLPYIEGIEGPGLAAVPPVAPSTPVSTDALALAPLPEAELASMALDSLTGGVPVEPMPVEQLEAMFGGDGGAPGEAVGMAPMSEEALTTLAAMEGSMAEVETPLSVGELENMLAGGDAGGLPDFAPLPEEELAVLGESEMPTASGASKAPSRSRQRAKPRTNTTAK